MSQSEETPPCPLCQGKIKFRYTIERFDPPFSIYRCESCGLEMQHPLPENPDLYYDDGYYTGKSGFSYRDERRTEHFDDYVLKARLKTIGRYVPPPADFLDVGCSFGAFVRQAGKQGYRARGMDVSSYAVNAARESGLDVVRGKPGTGNLAPESQDIITLVEVLEHLENPDSSLKELAAALRPGGLLLLQTANFEGLQAKRAGKDYHYYLPGHLYYYSTRNLESFLKKNGFVQVIFYRGVDFGLRPKLLKSRGNFKRARDYLRWLPISWYHFKSRISLGHFALTSSMVIYAIKGGSPDPALRPAGSDSL